MTNQSRRLEISRRKRQYQDVCAIYQDATPLYQDVCA